jgi:hypothetical protein
MLLSPDQQWRLAQAWAQQAKSPCPQRKDAATRQGEGRLASRQ